MGVFGPNPDPKIPPISGKNPENIRKNPKKHKEKWAKWSFKPKI
jgi:hypothetical protein